MSIYESLKLDSIKKIVKKLTGNGSESSTSGADAQDIHLGEPGFLHKVLRGKELESVFLFVTSKCNSKCRTCFYADKLNSKDDLTFEEIRKISETAPVFDKLWLSGGEPFLRRDLAEIIELFYENNRVKVINLPTNGLLGSQYAKVVDRLLTNCPKMTVHLNFSLDGLGPTHDDVRGVPGNFTKTIKALEQIKDRFGDNQGLICNVATVVTPQAYDEMEDLAAYVLQKDFCATHFFETVRGNPKDPEVKKITRRQIEDLHERLLPYYDKMGERLFADMDPRARWLARLYFVGVIRFMFMIQEQNIDGPHDWGMACTAGKTTAVIDHNGAFRACEMRPPIGNLRDWNCDFSAALNSAAMRSEIAAIGGGKAANCWCTHGCWVLSSLKFSPRTLLARIPWQYIDFKLKRLPSLDTGGLDLASIEDYSKKEAGRRVSA